MNANIDPDIAEIEEESQADRDFSIFARNVRRTQKRRCLTLDEMAIRCGIGRRTLVRIRRGERCTIRTQRKIANGLETYLDLLWDTKTFDPERYHHFTPESLRWLFFENSDAQRWGLNEEPGKTSPEKIQDGEERLRLGRNGLSRGFVALMGCVLPRGMQNAVFCEVFGHIEIEADLEGGDIFCYCLRGAVRFFLGTDTIVLRQGEALAREWSIDTAWEPEHPVGLKDLPPLLMWVMMNPPPKARKR